MMARIEQESFGELAYPIFVLRQLFDLHGRHWIVAYDSSSIQGYAMVCVDSDYCAWILGLGVSLLCRGRGLGRGLLGRAMDQCRRCGAERVRITVRPDNAIAAQLYRSAGFIRIDYEENYFGAGNPREVLEHTLGNGVRPWTRADTGDHQWIKQSGRPQP
ncbi:GNAT family N-acetyltransferase [Nocardia bovistercoris]|uniref:GNAT family N-acetyltransferase n=1 Tax=Nocardia bovistercoris TaxID=2785916 RepID=A0A931I8J1_9NOCA|nr:GNAT family N-acetyltransferase [Nocardia bovistercoris]MBH0775712.1 GNAT family N-acetyltransferase [Nocardia bovistercoris]